MLSSSNGFKKKADSFENIDLEKVYKMRDKRSKINTTTNVKWLKSRASKTTKKMYLYFPEELIKNIEIKQIFKTFDSDGSNSLDRGELEKMFNKYNFNISKKDLKPLFKIVDDDKNDALNLKEFKKCALNEEANMVFTSMMRKVRKNQPLNEQEFKYFPMFFESMISFLSYRLNRDNSIKGLKKDGISIVEKLKKYVELLDLTSRFGSIPMNNKKKEGVEASQLSLSSLNSPLLMRSKSFFKHSPKSFKRSGHTYFQEKLDPMEDFTKRFNQMQNNKINSNNKLKNIRDMKREIKQIVQTAKKQAVEETTEKINKDFRPKTIEITPNSILRTQLFLNTYGLPEQANSLYSTGFQTRPVTHTSNLGNYMQSLPKRPLYRSSAAKLNFPIPKNLMEIDNVIYQNMKENGGKYLMWDQNNKGDSQNTKGLSKLKKDLKVLTEVAKSKYGINIEQEEISKENDNKELMFNLQPEITDFKVFNQEISNEANSAKKIIHESKTAIPQNKRSNYHQQDSSVPEGLLQKVFIANMENTGDVRFVKTHPNFRIRMKSPN